MNHQTDPVVALVYDFDRTLCTKDMQEYGFIPSIGMKAEDFWAEVNQFTNDEAMDNILAYMYLMAHKAQEQNLQINRRVFQEQGRAVEFYPGVLDWFERITAFGRQRHLAVEHYIVSSGLKEIIEGTPIAQAFKRIYACEFLYDANGHILWPKVAVNYTTKTQFLFRINKGVLDITSDSSKKLNQYMENRDRRIPFNNMIYLGDGMTDVPCMRLVNNSGGKSIAVFTGDDQRTALQLHREGRVTHVAQADYRPQSDLDRIVCAILEQIAAVEKVYGLAKPVEG